MVIVYIQCPFKFHHNVVNEVLRGDIHFIEVAVENFYFDNKRIPTDKEGLISLIESPNDNSSLWDGPYLRKIHSDPWENKYHYKIINSGNKEYLIYSFGPNGIDESGNYDDIINQEKTYKCELYNSCPTICELFRDWSIIITLFLWCIFTFWLLYLFLYKHIKN